MYMQVSKHTTVLFMSVWSSDEASIDDNNGGARGKVGDVTLVTVSDWKRRFGVVDFKGDAQLETGAWAFKS